MAYVVDFDTVSIVGLESSPVATIRNVTVEGEVSGRGTEGHAPTTSVKATLASPGRHPGCHVLPAGVSVQRNRAREDLVRGQYSFLMLK